MTVASPELKHPEFADGQSSRAQLRMRPAWSLLEAHCRKLRNVHLRQLFAEDPDRGERLAVQGAGIYLDYSKNRVTDETVRLLLQLAHESGLRDRIDAMFRGDCINVSENRAVLHVALRAPRDASIIHNGNNVVPEIHAVLDRMADFSDRLRRGVWKGHTGKRIRNVINIGIGGSDLGPVMAYEALKQHSDRSIMSSPASSCSQGSVRDALACAAGADRPQSIKQMVSPAIQSC
jgi:glucose-6-phosphate isomerase